MNLTAVELTDGYKLDHRRQYPNGTEYVYSNWTPRSNNHFPEAIDGSVVFGVQYLIKEYLIKRFNEEFFQLPEDVAVALYQNRINAFLGPNEVGTEHIKALHKLGYLPILIKSLPEGSVCPIRVPMLTVINTHPDFFWVTNYLETIMSAVLWLPMTSATTARLYYKELFRHAEETGFENDCLEFLCHDFSMRGMAGLEAAIMSGMAHLTSFWGSETIPAIGALEKYYNASDSEGQPIAGTIPASEHSVMCAGGEGEDELKTFKRFITELYPTGFVSIVSDTWDFWKVMTEYLPTLKNEILNREGRIVIRPDCYDGLTQVLTPQGWRYFTTIDENTLVAQVHDDGTYTFVKPEKYIKMPYKGKMVCFEDGKGKLDLCVTPNHRMVYTSNGQMKVQEADECSFYWGKDILRSAAAQTKGRELTANEELQIAFQADGSYTTIGNRIRFSFSKQRKIDRLISILNDCDYQYKIYKLKDGRYEFNIDVDASKYKKDFSWVDISSLDSNWCKEFIEELSYWDATRRHSNRFKFDTTNKEVIEIVELIALSAGYGVLISSSEDTRSQKFSTVYTAHILKDNKLGGQSITKSYIDFDDMVYCVKVPTGRLMVKRCGGQAVCGNSGNPADIICGIEPDIVIAEDEVFHSKEEAERYYASCIIDNLRDITPHGEYGGESHSLVFQHGNFYYRITVDNISWNRHDKQFYFIDMYEKPNVIVEQLDSTLYKGAYELLWDTFGGSTNEKGYRILDSHVGIIYGDSITLALQKKIYRRLEKKGFAASNLVLGIGSFTYQFRTRDSLGFAMKATWCQINGEAKEIYKQPKTDSGMKNSLKGLIRVENVDGTYVAYDQQSKEEEVNGELIPIFKDGKLLIETSLSEIRNRLKNGR